MDDAKKETHVMEDESIYRERFRILRKIGKGGTSTVYMGFDNETGKVVSIKKLRSEVTGNQDILRSVRKEAELLAGLDHPAIPKLIENYEDAMVLEYTPGNTLEKVFLRKGHLKEKEAIVVGGELLEVLGYLHELKVPVIYRDLKPSNIIMKPDGHVALIDFGAARVFREGAAADEVNLGTIGFAAPEQYGSLGQTDVRTDIYCWGRTMEQLVGGKSSRALAEVIEKCTRPDRDERFSTCKEIKRELEKCPKKVRAAKAWRNVKIAVVAAVLALAVTLTATYYDTVMSYAASDAEVRLPAVKQRLGYAGLRIKAALEERDIRIFMEDR